MAGHSFRQLPCSAAGRLQFHTNMSFTKEVIPMRTIILLTLASINITLLSACTTLDEQGSMFECPPMEGYPDCDNGHHVAYNAVSEADVPGPVVRGRF